MVIVLDLINMHVFFSYRQNVIRLRDLMQDEPMKPLERAVWWTEYVLRHRGAKHLRSPTANISWTQYLELELVLIILAITFITMTGIVILVLQIRYYASKDTRGKKTKQN